MELIAWLLGTMLDFLRVRRPPFDGKPKENLVKHLATEEITGRKASLGNLESDRGRPRWV